MNEKKKIRKRRKKESNKCKLNVKKKRERERENERKKNKSQSKKRKPKNSHSAHFLIFSGIGVCFPAKDPAKAIRAADPSGKKKQKRERVSFANRQKKFRQPANFPFSSFCLFVFDFEN